MVIDFMPPKPKNKHLEHAEHNKAACDYLGAHGDYNDWTIISAFYSALHYLSHKVFPHDHGGKIYSSCVENYMNLEGITNKSPHTVLLDLVYSKCNREIGHTYKRMLEYSKTARYVNYLFDPAEVKDVKQRLAKIVDYTK